MKRLLFDIETNAVDFDTNVHPVEQVHTVHCICIMDMDTKDVYDFYDTHDLRLPNTQSIDAALKLLENADEWTGHNILEFDIPVLEELYRIRRAPRIHDTLVQSRFLYTDRPGGHSLESYGERLGYPKDNFAEFGRFSPDLLNRCRVDVKLNYGVREFLRPDLALSTWDQCNELEHRIADIIARQARVGMQFDLEKAVLLAAEWAKVIDELDQQLAAIVGPRLEPGPTVMKPFLINGSLSSRVKTYEQKYDLITTDVAGPFCLLVPLERNFDSDQQNKQILLEYGWKPQKFTKGGAPSLDDTILGVPVVGLLLSQRSILSHRLGQLEGWIKRCNKNGRVHGGANPCGTNTHRMRHKVIANVPKKTIAYGQEMRELFVSAPGKILAGYDAKQLELRILAHYIGDPGYTAAVTSPDKTKDAHTLAALAAGSDNRDLGKTINFALTYGAGGPRLGAIIGKDEAAGEALKAKLYAGIPGLERLTKATKSAIKKGYLIALDGRKLYGRVAASPLNLLVQGGGAVYMKRVASFLDKDIGGVEEQVKVLDMHDEAQWEIPDTTYAREEFTSAVLAAFEDANKFYNLRCPQEPDVKFGMNWAETH